jgi:hypothetical protein
MATTTTTRRLTAILAADVAGYSRLMGADEEGPKVRFAPDSALERGGFEPSVPGEGNYAPQGADSFTRGADVRTPFPPPPDLSQGCIPQLSGVALAGLAW